MTPWPPSSGPKSNGTAGGKGIVEDGFVSEGNRPCAGVAIFVRDAFGRRMSSEQLIDTSELKKIAELTEGRFYRERDAGGLEEVYAESERLERTPGEGGRFVEHYGLYSGCLLAALSAWLLAWTSAFTWARRLP